MKILVAAVLSLIVAAVAAAQAFGADLDYAAPGSLAVRQVDVTWTDPARERALPLRLRLPEGSQRRPVIIFSHGLGGSVAGGAEWGEQWASRGFAVIHVQHPGSDESLWKDKPASEPPLLTRSIGATLIDASARVAASLICVELTTIAK